MRAAIPVRTLCALAALAAAQGEIIDRIAVSVGNSVVTTSDLDREIRVTAFLNRMPPDFGAANRRATASRMVDQNLIRRELELSRYPAPKPAAAEKELNEFQKEYFHTEMDFQNGLRQAGVSQQEVQDELLWQLTLLRFIEVRFQPGVEVSEQDIESYFEKTVKPAAEAANPGKPIRLADYHDQIEETLTGQRSDQELNQWLEATRQRTDIVYHQEVFQ